MNSSKDFYSVDTFLSMLLKKKKNSETKNVKKKIDSLIKHGNIDGTIKQDETFITSESADTFISNVISFKSILEKLDITYAVLNLRIRLYNLPFYKFGKELDEVFLEYDMLYTYITSDTHISYIKFMGMLNYDFTDYAYKNLIKNFRNDKDLAEVLGYRHLEIPLYFTECIRVIRDVFCEKKVREFLSNHVSIQFILTENNINGDNFIKYINSRNIKQYSLLKSYELKFISKNDYQVYRDYKFILDNPNAKNKFLVNNQYYIDMIKEDLSYSTMQIVEFLKLNSLANLDEILNEFEISPSHSFRALSRNFNYYKRTEIDRLVEVQQQMLEKYSKEYYTSEEIRKKHSDIPLDFLLYNTPNIQTICPLIIRTFFNTHVLYKKKTIDTLLQKKIEERDLRNIKLDDPYDEFIYKVKHILKLEFSSNIKLTEKLWNDYAKATIYKANTEHARHISINQLVKSTNTLTNILEKEIFLYSPMALNRLIFNGESTSIQRTSQGLIYSFLKNILNNLSVHISSNLMSIDEINNPHYFTDTKVVDNSRYSFEEYESIFKHASNLELHKKQAIKDVKSYLNNNVYYKYDSYWVYVLTHLTNNWRHGTIVTEIPQIDISQTQVADLDWLYENSLSLEDANKIIYQVGLTIKKISKTGAESEFRISEPLKIPFATALIICQLRINNDTKIDNKYLLNLKENRTIARHHSVHQQFFGSLSDEFHFSNRKMNKTLSTLIWTIFNDIKNVKVSRSHFSEESTLRYIKLDDSQLEKLVSMLFSNDTFGYIYNLLTDSIFENSGSNLSNPLNNSRSHSIQNRFGDVQKIEVSAGLINKLSKDHKDSIQIINSMTIEEKMNIVLGALTNTLFSKQKYYQCVFSECKFKNQTIEMQDCMSCPYSITNVYGLSNLMNLYLDIIKKVINDFETSKPGQKQRLANQLYLLWIEIQLAKEKFGDAIYEFVDGGKERFTILSHRLPHTQQFLTVQKDVLKNETRS